MESILEQLIIELYIIGSVKAHERLSTQQGTLKVDHVSETWWRTVSWPMQSVRRMWYGESRTKTVEYVHSIVHRAMHMLQSWRSPDIADGPSAWARTMLLDALRRAQTGLEEMKLTYADDAGTVAALDVLWASAQTYTM